MPQHQPSTEELAGRQPAHARANVEEERGDGKLSDELASAEERPSERRAEARAPVLDVADAGHFRERWESIQTHFVDEPRGSVEQADALVAEVVQQLARDFAQERDRLEDQWERDEHVSTEELRVALMRYRSFFDRLLSA
jgi:hypothetical protein